MQCNVRPCFSILTPVGSYSFLELRKGTQPQKPQRFWLVINPGDRSKSGTQFQCKLVPWLANTCSELYMSGATLDHGIFGGPHQELVQVGHLSASIVVGIAGDVWEPERLWTISQQHTQTELLGPGPSQLVAWFRVPKVSQEKILRMNRMLTRCSSSPFWCFCSYYTRIAFIAHLKFADVYHNPNTYIKNTPVLKHY